MLGAERQEFGGGGLSGRTGAPKDAQGQACVPCPLPGSNRGLVHPSIHLPPQVLFSRGADGLQRIPAQSDGKHRDVAVAEHKREKGW